MRHILHRRMLGALAALGLAFSVAPASLTATAVDGRLPACSVPHLAQMTDADGAASTSVAAVSGAEMDADGQRCGHGPCPMPLTTCAGAGACLSLLPLPSSASAPLSSGLFAASHHGTDRGPLSPTPSILTPPPRS